MTGSEWGWLIAGLLAFCVFGPLGAAIVFMIWWLR